MPWSQSVPVGNDGGPAGQAELEQLKHAAKIGVRRSFANLSPRIRIHNQLAIPGGDPVGWSGPTAIVRTLRASAPLAHG
jgi:hypothetical protein